MSSATVKDWQRRPLGELSKTTSGGTPSRKRKDYFDGSIPWVKSGELNDDYIDGTGEHISEQGLKNSSAKLFQPGTLLIALYGATVGKTSILRIEASTNQAVCGITPGSELDTEYLRFHLVHLRPELLSHRYGGAQPNISQQVVRNLEVDYPPLPEQKKIAHILSTVQRAIEAQERIIQTTTELKKALMHKLFTEGLRNEAGRPHRQKQTEIGPVPESWEVVPFDKFATLQRGYDLRKQDFREGEVPVIGATKVIGYHDTSNVKAPGVTVVRSGSSAGKPLFIAEDFWAHNVLLYVKDFQGNVPKFVYYKILALDLTQYRQGVAVPTLNRNTFSAIELALPTREEQQEIADALDAIGDRTEVAERKKTQLQDLFRTLLHELMTAKTRVHELELHQQPLSN